MQRHTSPRFAVLPLAPVNGHPSYVIVDQATGRIVDGVYSVRAMALDVAAFYSGSDLPVPEERTPSAEGLGLLFPTLPKQRRSA
jgi:hypothetical protein